MALELNELLPLKIMTKSSFNLGLPLFIFANAETHVTPVRKSRHHVTSDVISIRSIPITRWIIITYSC